MISVHTGKHQEAVVPPLFRLVQLDDAPEILAIYNDCVRTRQSCGHTEPIRLMTVLDWLDNMSAERPIWVVESQGQLIAWFAVEDFYGLPAFESVVEVSVYIQARYQRQGLGGQVLTYIEAYLQTIHVSHMVAYIYAHNAASIALFKRHQFEQWGRLPQVALLGGQRFDLLLLGKCLI